tara:strand:- start:255 stop:1064 length:810 start_codon:yes stop_codon:yes gene_type:complete
MTTVRSGGVDIDYEILNPGGKGIPVFFISGLGGIRNSWEKQLSSFISRGPVVLHDHRGTGKSEKPSGVYSVEKMAEDVVSIMDDLSIKKAHMVGTSTGGAIIQILCIKFGNRIQSGVIASSWPKSDPYFIRQFKVRKEILMNMGWETHNRLSSFTLYSPEFFSNNYIQIVENEKKQLASMPPKEIMAERIDCIIKHDQLEGLPKIKTPILVLVGREDFVTPVYYSEKIASLIPKAELKIFGKGGHFIYLTYPNEFNNTVLNFIERNEIF